MNAERTFSMPVILTNIHVKTPLKPAFLRTHFQTCSKLLCILHSFLTLHHFTKLKYLVLYNIISQLTGDTRSVIPAHIPKKHTYYRIILTYTIYTNLRIYIQYTLIRRNYVNSMYKLMYKNLTCNRRLPGDFSMHNIHSTYQQTFNNIKLIWRMKRPNPPNQLSKSRKEA